MGCGCINLAKPKVSINNHINKNNINDFNKTEKEERDNKEKKILNLASNNNIIRKNTLNKKSLSLKNKYSYREKNYYATNEDYSEYYLLLGNDIEPLTIKTEIFISCKGIKNFRRSFCYYILIEKRDGKFWSFFGQTEISRYTADPSFVKSFIINYNFRENKEKQIFRFTVKYIEKDEKTFSLGAAETNLKTLFSTKNQELTLDVLDKRKIKGQITIKGGQKKNISEFIQMRIGIKGPKITTNENKIFCRISRKTNNKNEILPLYVTEEKEHLYDKKEKVFYWKLIEFDSDRIAKKQLISQLDINIITFEIFEVIKKKKERPLTKKELNIDSLINGSEYNEYNLPKVNDDYYYLVVDQIKKINHYSFFAFLISGMHYTPYFFIDCTRSKFNLILSEKFGNKFSKKFISKYKKDIDNNEQLIYHPWYNINFKNDIQGQNIDKLNEKIFQNINGANNFNNNIILSNDDEYNLEENFDINIDLKNPFENKEKLSSDYIKYINELFNSLIKDQFLLNINNRSPVFLFGGRVPKENQIECYNFSYNGDILNPEIEDYKEMQKVYNNLLSKIFLSFPCLIQDCLNHFYKYVSNEKFTEKNQIYHVAFFILTNYMNDVNYLFEFLLKYNNLPFSIIIVSLGDEFKSEEFESKIEEYINENKNNGSFRNNIIYINFNSINFNAIDYEMKINTFCKQIYHKLSQQFVNFIKLVNINPFDSTNLSNKNTPNFLELRKNYIYNNYIIPKFLIQEKEKIIKEIIDLGFSNELFEYTFGNKLPTFDKHFIISMLNGNKNKFEKMKKNNEKANSFIGNKIKMESKEYFQFNEQMLIDEREFYFGESKKKETSINKESENVQKEEKINDEICNFCKTNPINIIFQYCKHKYSCLYCLSKIKNKICPICKNKIDYFVRTYNN